MVCILYAASWRLDWRWHSSLSPPCYPFLFSVFSLLYFSFKCYSFLECRSPFWVTGSHWFWVVLFIGKHWHELLVQSTLSLRSCEVLYYCVGYHGDGWAIESSVQSSKLLLKLHCTEKMSLISFCLGCGWWVKYRQLHKPWHRKHYICPN